MQQEEQRQPHVTYNVFTGGPPAPPPAPPASPVAVDPNREVEALERRLQQEKQQSEQKLHEAMAASQQTANQKMLEIRGEVKRAEDLARAAAAASTDEIRQNRGTQAWNKALVAELRQAREAAAAAQGQVVSMQNERRAFFEQQMANEVEKAKEVEEAK